MYLATLALAACQVDVCLLFTFPQLETLTVINLNVCNTFSTENGHSSYSGFSAYSDLHWTRQSISFTLCYTVYPEFFFMMAFSNFMSDMVRKCVWVRRVDIYERKATKLGKRVLTPDTLFIHCISLTKEIGKGTQHVRESGMLITSLENCSCMFPILASMNWHWRCLFS